MPRDRIVPLIIAVALFMENMDSTVISTSLPAIAADIGANPLALKLAVTSYLLSLAIFIPASGWTVDRFGARTVFRAAIAVFVLGSIGCAVSSSLTDFVLARIVQGIGGAMMVPVGRLIVLRNTEKQDLIRAIAFLTWPALTAPVIGPPLGGLITTYSSWPWIFLLNVPLGIIGLALVVVGTNTEATLADLADLAPKIADGTERFAIPRDRLATLREIEDEYIEWMIEQCGGNKTRAAERLGIDKATLHRRARQRTRE